MAKDFKCTLVTPQEEILDETVIYASIPSWDGLIGLEPMRAPMLVKLGDGLLRLDYDKGGSRHFFIGGGFAQMQDNELSLIANEAVAADQLVKSDVEKDLKEAQDRSAIAEDDITRKARDINRGKAMLKALDKIKDGI